MSNTELGETLLGQRGNTLNQSLPNNSTIQVARQNVALQARIIELERLLESQRKGNGDDSVLQQRVVELEALLALQGKDSHDSSSQTTSDGSKRTSEAIDNRDGAKVDTNGNDGGLLWDCACILVESICMYQCAMFLLKSWIFWRHGLKAFPGHVGRMYWDFVTLGLL